MTIEHAFTASVASGRRGYQNQIPLFSNSIVLENAKILKFFEIARGHSKFRASDTRRSKPTVRAEHRVRCVKPVARRTPSPNGAIILLSFRLWCNMSASNSASASTSAVDGPLATTAPVQPKLGNCGDALWHRIGTPVVGRASELDDEVSHFAPVHPPDTLR